MIEKNILPFYNNEHQQQKEESKDSDDPKHIREKCMLMINLMRLVRAIRNSPTYCHIKGGQQIESSVFYRSDFLLELHSYIENAYWPTKQRGLNDFYLKFEKGEAKPLLLATSLEYE